MKYEIAVFEYTDTLMKGYRTVGGVEIHDNIENTVRISEVVEVDFPERDESEIIPEMVSSIDKEISSLEIQYLEKINVLKGKKAELLSITFQGESS